MPDNVNIVITRLNSKVAFVNKLDDNEFDHMLAEILKDNKLYTARITFDQVLTPWQRGVATTWVQRQMEQ